MRQERSLQIRYSYIVCTSPLSYDSPFERVVAVLRSSSASQLHFPVVHEKAQEYFSTMLSARKLSILTPRHLHEALLTARSLRIESVRVLIRLASQKG